MLINKPPTGDGHPFAYFENGKMYGCSDFKMKTYYGTHASKNGCHNCDRKDSIFCPFRNVIVGVDWANNSD